MPRNKHQSGMAGTFAVAAELCRREYEVALTLGNSPHIDLLCASPSGVPFKIQVKAAASPTFVPIGRAWLESPPNATLYLITALIPADSATTPFRFFIISHAEAVALWAAVPKLKKNGEPYKAGWEGFAWPALMSHENAWTKLPQ